MHRHLLSALSSSLALAAAALSACGDDDGGADTREVSGETTIDTTPETTPDTVEDTAPDTVEDTAPDTVADTTPDTVEDTTPDTVEDTTPDTLEDTTPDTVEDTTPDTVVPGCDRVGFSGLAYVGGNYFAVSGADGELTVLFPPDTFILPGEYTAPETEIFVFTPEGVAFLASEGLLTLEAFDNFATYTVRATLTDATLLEHMFDEVSGLYVPVPDGEVWCIDRLEIDTAGTCTTDFDCAPDAPVCSPSLTSRVDACTSEQDLCGGDDPSEPAGDSMHSASPLTVDTPVAAKICGERGTATAGEADWYHFELTETSSVRFELAWSGTDIDLDLYVFDASGGDVASSYAQANPESAYRIDLPVGRYYVKVKAFAGAPTAALDYTLSVTTFEPDCRVDSDCTDPVMAFCEPSFNVCTDCYDTFDCTSPDAPVCVESYEFEPTAPRACGPGPALCAGDDASEPGDDGPAGARVLTLPASVDAFACTAPDANTFPLEEDYYAFTLTERSYLIATAQVPDERAVHLNILHRDGHYVFPGSETYGNPRVVETELMEPGDYVIEVFAWSGEGLIPYTLTVAETPAACMEHADCTDAAAPYCDTLGNACVACLDSFDCTSAAAPYCMTDELGVPVCTSGGECSDDDDGEPEDDGPAGAQVVTLPSDPIQGRICGDILEAGIKDELDYYQVTLPAGASLEVTLAWDNPFAWFDLDVFDADGAYLYQASGDARLATAAIADVAAGDYYVRVNPTYGAMETVDYTLTLVTPTP